MYQEAMSKVATSSQLGYGTGTEMIRDCGPLTGEINRAFTLLEVLVGAVTTLTERIEPVMSAPYPEPGEKCTEKNGPSSQLHGNVLEINERISRITNLLRTLSDRVTI
jgi:hypothetical protein